MTADANILINYARSAAQNYLLTYNQEIPCEQLVRRLCDLKQGYTQHGGLRPFGVSFIYAGYDDQRQFQLYQSNPSGNYGGWKATSVGANNASAQSLLKQDYNDECSLREACGLAVKVLSKTMDSTNLSSEKSTSHIDTVSFVASLTHFQSNLPQSARQRKALSTTTSGAPRRSTLFSRSMAWPSPQAQKKPLSKLSAALVMLRTEAKLRRLDIFFPLCNSSLLVDRHNRSCIFGLGLRWRFLDLQSGFVTYREKDTYENEHCMFLLNPRAWSLVFFDTLTFVSFLFSFVSFHRVKKFSRETRKTGRKKERSQTANILSLREGCSSLVGLEIWMSSLGGKRSKSVTWIFVRAQNSDVMLHHASVPEKVGW